MALSAARVRILALALIFFVAVGSESIVPVLLPWIYSTRNSQYIIDTLPKCQTRVSSMQQVLFSTHVYLAGYNVSTADGQYVSWVDEDQTVNAMLCRMGFRGNQGLYGLGIRVGLYLQWAGILLSNHILSETPTRVSQAYLLVTAAMLVKLVRVTASDSCAFSVEAIILYHMLLCGYIIWLGRSNVFRATGTTIAKVITWRRLAEQVLSALMLAHMAWFWLVGHNWYFMSMPYETVYFVLRPVSRDYIDENRFSYQLWTCGMLAYQLYRIFILIIAFPRDIAKLVTSSKPYRLVFPNSHCLQSKQPQVDEAQTPADGESVPKHNLVQQASLIYEGGFVDQQLPPQSRRRSYTIIFNAVVSCGCFVYAIIAIESIIRWNNITRVNSLDTTGQVFYLLVGLCTLVIPVYELVKEKRRGSVGINDEDRGSSEKLENKAASEQVSLY